MTAANKQSSASNPPLRLSDNAIKPDPTTQLLCDAGLVHQRHQEPRLRARVPIPNIPRQGHHHHHHHHHHNHDYEEEEEEDAEIAACSHAKAAPNRPAINRGIAVNIAFRIAALDVDCEGYMYMLTQTGDRECGHPILPVKARGCEWRAFRDDMLTRFGWGSVLSATWLQSYNWACKILNIEVDRILVGIDTQTSLINAAKSRIGLDSTQDHARESHSCHTSDPSFTRPSTSTSQPSTPAQLGTSAKKSVSTKAIVDHHHIEPGSAVEVPNGIPSDSASAEPIKSNASKASSTAHTSGSNTKTKSEKSSGIAENNSPVYEAATKSRGRKNDVREKEEEARRTNPIEDIFHTCRETILQDCYLSVSTVAAAVDPTLPIRVVSASGATTTSNPSSPSKPSGPNKNKNSPSTNASIKSPSPSPPPPPSPQASHSTSATTTTTTPPDPTSASNPPPPPSSTSTSSSPSPPNPTTPNPSCDKKSRRNRRRKRKPPTPLASSHPAMVEKEEDIIKRVFPKKSATKEEVIFAGSG